MTDDAELIARLRDAPADGLGTENLCLAAADRIEALTAELATCEKYRDAYDEMGRIGTHAVRDLEAKLAKAVDLAIEECPFRHGTPRYNDWWHHRRATLAEIKGESRE